MPSGLPHRSCLVLCLAVLLAGFVANAESRARENPRAKNKGAQAAKQALKLSEAEALQDAYLLLAGANANYAGHRAKAMHHIHEAYKMLHATSRKKAAHIEDSATS